MRLLPVTYCTALIRQIYVQIPVLLFLLCILSQVLTASSSSAINWDNQDFLYQDYEALVTVENGSCVYWCKGSDSICTIINARHTGHLTSSQVAVRTTSSANKPFRVV